MKKNVTFELKQNLSTISEKSTIVNRAYKNHLKPIEVLDMGKQYNGNCRQVVCIDTLEIFPSVSSLAKRLNAQATNISYAIRHGGNYKGYTYVFADEWNQYKAKISGRFCTPNKKRIVENGESTQFDFYKVRHNKITDKKVHGNSHPVLCLNTFERFPSISALSKYLEISIADVATYIKHGRPIRGRRYIDLSRTPYYQNDIIEAGLNVVQLAKDIIKSIEAGNKKALNSSPFSPEIEAKIKLIKE